MSSVPPQVELTNSDIKNPARRIQSRDYSKKISRALDMHRRMSVVKSAGAKNQLYGLCDNNYERIDKAYEVYDTDRKEHSREELLTVISEILAASDFTGMRGRLISVAEDISNDFLGYYEEQIIRIFSQQPFESMAARYRLSADLRAEQGNKVSAIITNKCLNLFTNVQDIESRRNALVSGYEAYVQMTSGNLDWGALAKNIGAGVLIAANPFIGIPEFIANTKFELDKDKANQLQVGKYLAFFDEYEDCLITFRQNFVTAGVRVEEYITEKFAEVNVNAIENILNQCANENCNLDRYFDALDFKNLKMQEKQLLMIGN